MSNLPFNKPLDKETSRAYAAFCVYRDLGVVRSLDEAYRLDIQERYKKPAPKKPASRVWAQWSIDYSWVARAKLYDTYLAEKERLAREEKHIEELADYRKRLAELSRLTMNTGTALLNRCLKRIQAMSKEEIDSLDVKQLSPLIKAANDSIEKGMDGWGVSLGVDELLEMLEDDND